MSSRGAKTRELPYLAPLCRHPDYADEHRRDHVDQYHEGS